jgi:drug/metabolite transporter (DMT)-like permease
MVMNHAASALVLLSGAAHAVVNAVLKSGNDKMSGRVLIDGFSALLIAPAALLVPLPTNAWGWLAASWVLHLLYTYALIRSFEQADMSVSYPIARGLAPSLAAIGAVTLFHEPINAYVVAGIACIGAGVFLIGISHALKKSDLRWAVATACCIACYTVVDAQGVRAAPTPASYIVWIFLMLGGGVGAVIALFLGKRFLQSFAKQWKPGLIAGLLSIVSYGSAMLAFRFGATPRLAALRETSILFGVAIAVVFLKERLTRWRVLGIASIALGTIFLV